MKTRITLYDLTFTFFLLLTAFTVIASGATLIFQAKLTGSTANWNVFIIVGSYVALAVVSILIYLSRRTSTARRLKTIPKSYVAIKIGDVPKPISNLIASEFYRACIITHISLPAPGYHEGWGIPGTKYENIYFRRAILDTLPSLDTPARTLLPSLPPLRPHLSPKHHFSPLSSLIATLDSSVLDLYDEIIRKARYESVEPGEGEWEYCGRVVGRLGQIFEFYMEQLRAGNGEWSNSVSGRTSLDTVPSME